MYLHVVFHSLKLGMHRKTFAFFALPALLVAFMPCLPALQAQSTTAVAGAKKVESV